MDASEVARALAALRKRVDQSCEVCARSFTAYAGARFCSPACRQAAYRKRELKRLADAEQNVK